MWLVEREGYERVEHLDIASSEQRCDIITWRDGKLWAFQCKQVRRFGLKAALAEAEKALALPESERPAGLVFIVTCDVSRNTRRQVRKRCAEENLECHFWSGSELSEKVKRYPDIIAELFARQGRRVDAAAPSQTKIGQQVDLLVQVRFPYSQLLGAQDKDWPLKQKPSSVEQASKSPTLEFPMDPETGELGPAYLQVQVVAPFFQIEGAERQRVQVSPYQYSECISFLLTAMKTGSCRINIEVYRDTDRDVPLGTIPFVIETFAADAVNGGINGTTASQTLHIGTLVLAVTVVEGDVTGSTVVTAGRDVYTNLEALTHSDPDVRRCAAEALSKLENVQAVKPLIAVLRGEHDASDLGDAREAIRHCEQALEIAREIGDQRIEDIVVAELRALKNARVMEHFNLAVQLASNERFAEALSHAERAKEAFTQIGDAHYTQEAQLLVAQISFQWAMHLGQNKSFAEALSHAERAEEALAQISDAYYTQVEQRLVAVISFHMALWLAYNGRFSEALLYAKQSARYFALIGEGQHARTAKRLVTQIRRLR